MLVYDGSFGLRNAAWKIKEGATYSYMYGGGDGTDRRIRKRHKKSRNKKRRRAGLAGKMELLQLECHSKKINLVVSFAAPLIRF